MKTRCPQEEGGPANHLTSSHLFYTSFKSIFSLTNRGNLETQQGECVGTTAYIVPFRDSGPPNLLALWCLCSWTSGGRPMGTVSKLGTTVWLCLESHRCLYPLLPGDLGMGLIFPSPSGPHV